MRFRAADKKRIRPKLRGDGLTTIVASSIRKYLKSPGCVSYRQNVLGMERRLNFLVRQRRNRRPKQCKIRVDISFVSLKQTFNIPAR
jgi:hypothetical protein